MFIISSIIVTVVLVLIANAAHVAICKKYPDEEIRRPDLTPDELLKRAYRGAYYANLSMLEDSVFGK
jgi:hypothetical protein